MKKILIVEDNEVNLDLMIQLLEDDYSLISASDGLQAIEIVARERPDLILMDMSLPILDGWEATRRIKADPNTQYIPIIGLSAHAMSGDKEKALEAGCNSYLTKPINFDLLYQTIEQYI